MDVDCRWPGSVHDATVFANSSIGKKLRENNMMRKFQTIGYEKIPNYIIGDPAYPLTPYLMKEYESCRNNEEVIFNNMLRSERNPIECAFGRLKARWSILRKHIDLKLENVPIIIYTCFILHNICELKNSYVDEMAVESQIDIIKQNEEEFENIPDPVYSANTDEGNVTRKILTNHIAINLPDYLTSV